MAVLGSIWWLRGLRLLFFVAKMIALRGSYGTNMSD